MKKYDLYAITDLDEEIYASVPYESDNGDWVRAETAQRLYEALSGLLAESEAFARAIPAYGNSEPLAAAREALTLVDEE